MTKRNIGSVILLMLVTFGFYMIYWFVVTKNELNATYGKHIPTGWLLIIPFINLYFLYEFAKAFANSVFNDDSRTIPYFLLLVLLMPVGIIICQSDINSRT